MMFKYKKILKAFFIILIAVCFTLGYKAKASENGIAIIYDCYSEFGSDDNKLASLVNMCLKTGKAIELINEDSYKEGTSDKYNSIIIMHNSDNKVQETLKKDLLKFQGKTLWIGKGLVDNTKIKHIEQFSSKNENYSLIENEINKIINGYEIKEQKVYVLIDEMSPFVDLNKFVQKIDFLHDNGYSFICSIMPIYKNENFEAMKNYFEVLRYAQENGGKIILHSSVILDNDISGKKVKDKMVLAQEIYVKNGIYPLALDIPKGFLFREDYKELINSTNVIFLDNKEKVGIIDFQKYSIKGFAKVVDKVNVEDVYRYRNNNLAHDIAFKFNANLDIDVLKNETDKIIKKDFYFNNVNYINSNIKLGNVELSFEGRNILLNNKPVEDLSNNIKGNDGTKEVKNDNNKIDISKFNSRVLSITIFMSLVFLMVMVVSSKIDRNKYFK